MRGGRNTSVLLLHDQALVRAGLRMLIERQRGFEVIAEAGDVPEAMRKAKAHKPSLILLAQRGLNREALAAVPDLVSVSGASVIALADSDEPGLVRAALNAGVAGFLLPTASPAELSTALERVRTGEGYIHPTAGARFAREEGKRRAEASGEQLTKREREIVALLALGHTNREIAEQLKISVRTAEWHRGRIQSKLELASRAALTRFAIASGLVGDLAAAEQTG